MTSKASAHDDGLDMDRVTQRTVSANGAARPATTGPRSAFDLVPPPARKPRAPVRAFDPAAVEIKRGTPIPVRNAGLTGARYQTLLDRMKPGDCVELEPVFARGLQAYAKKVKVPVAMRKLSDEVIGVWRTK